MNKYLDHLRIDVRVDSMPQIGDVALPAKLLHHVSCRLTYLIWIAIQCRRIQVALQGLVGANEGTGFFNAHIPVQADGLTGEFAQGFSRKKGSFGKYRDRHFRDGIADLGDVL